MSLIPRGWLRRPSASIRTGDPKILIALKPTVDKLTNILYSGCNAAGIAAPQILERVRIIGVLLQSLARPKHGRITSSTKAASERKRMLPGEPLILLNPKIEWTSKRTIYGYEQCLSFKRGAIIKRPVAVVVSGFDCKQRKRRVLNLNWGDARIILHELDHLNGIVISSEKFANRINVKNEKLK